MNLRLTFTYALLLLCYVSQAQSPLLWKKFYDRMNKVSSLSVGDDGSLFITGQSSREDVYGEAWYGKVSVKGDSIWIKQWQDWPGCKANEFIPLNGDGGFLAGYFEPKPLKFPPDLQGYYTWVTMDGARIAPGSSTGDKDKTPTIQMAVSCSNGTIVGGGYPSKGSGLQFIRFSPEGKVLKSATHKIPGVPHLADFKEKANGNIIAVGYTSDYNYDDDIMLFELDSNLNVLWSKVPDSAYCARAESVCITSDGGFIVSGLLAGPHGPRKAWYGRFDDKGNMIWAHELGASALYKDQCRVIAYDKDHFVLARSICCGPRYMDIGMNDLSFILFDGQGKTLWEYTHITDQGESLTDMVLGKDMSILVAGRAKKSALRGGTVEIGYIYCFRPQIP